jgi:glycosyltransferase involved in cell wall biosynthesis
MGMIISPKISIITPCFNAAQYIEQTILSIINQEYDNLEYIIIDGGSTDGTVDIIKKYEDKITYWISEPDKGQSDAINKGIAIANGEVFNWVNGDDYLEKDALKLVGEYFKKSDIDVLCTSTYLFNSSGIIRINGNTKIDIGLFDLLNTTGLNQQGMFWRMDRINELKGVNTDFTYSMDLDLWKRYVINYGINNVIIDPVITGYFRLSDDSKTGSDFETNFHLFENENNAALIHYASLIGKEYVDVIKLLYPNYKKELASKQISSKLDTLVIKNWMKQLIYNKAQRFFYANEFMGTYQLLKLAPLKDFSGIELKNLKSFKRWSNIKRWI